MGITAAHSSRSSTSNAGSSRSGSSGDGAGGSSKDLRGWVRLLCCWAVLLLLLLHLQAHTALARSNPAGVRLRGWNRGIRPLGHIRALRQVSPPRPTVEPQSELSDDRSDADRQLLGPGSSPPKCTSKCGRCVPCRPVHVPIQPGTLLPAEYYPEAWRCKCGNRLYMP